MHVRERYAQGHRVFQLPRWLSLVHGPGGALCSGRCAVAAAPRNRYARETDDAPTPRLPGRARWQGTTLAVYFSLPDAPSFPSRPSQCGGSNIFDRRRRWGVSNAPTDLPTLGGIRGVEEHPVGRRWKPLERRWNTPPVISLDPMPVAFAALRAGRTPRCEFSWRRAGAA